MRVSESGMVRTVLRDIMQNRQRLSELHQQASSGTRVRRPSDDPGATATVMQGNSTLSEVEQFESNSSMADEWLSATESVLSEATNSVHRLKELAVRGAGGSMPESSLEALGKEAEQITDHLRSLANTRHGGRYIFSGFKTDTEPFSLNGGDLEDYGGDNGEMIRQIGPDVDLQVNLAGDEVFEDLLDAAVEITKALDTGDSAELQVQMGELDDAMDQLLSARSEVGGRMNRLQLSQQRLEDMKIFMNKVISDASDVDMAEAIMNLSATERSFEVALATAARILPNTLLDYLR